MKPSVYIIAGPNGAGKTTFATEFLPRYAHAPHFINADLIAQGLSPFSPETVALRAGRIMLDEIRRAAGRGQDFGFETTLAGKAHLRLLHELREVGYDTHLFFLWVPSAELVLSRIKTRVAKGGHDVPAAIVRRRFERSLANFFQYYRRVVNSWTLVDNSTITPTVIASQQNGMLHIIDKDHYHSLLREYGHTS